MSMETMRAFLLDFAENALLDTIKKELRETMSEGDYQLFLDSPYLEVLRASAIDVLIEFEDLPEKNPAG